MSGLSREVIKWIQSLDLTSQIKTPKWDISNGYLIAEIISWYFPQEIQMHMFYNNGASLDTKLKNWSLLTNFFKRHKFDVPKEYIDGTIHCREGAATLLVENIYELLTHRRIAKTTTEGDIDFTDSAYQAQLPLHARSTAAQAIKSNIKTTELMEDPSIILGQHKALNIIYRQEESRKQERTDFPDRFDKKPTLGELSLRRAPLANPNGSEDEEVNTELLPSANKADAETEVISREPSIQFREVKVKQLDKTDHYRTEIPGY